MPTYRVEDIGNPFGPVREASEIRQEGAQRARQDRLDKLPSAARAAFETENIGVATIQRAVAGMREGSTTPVPGYNPFDDAQVQDGRFDGLEHAFTESMSPQETALIKNRLLRGMDNQEALANAGAAGIGWVLAASIVDPINAVPGLGAAGKARTVGGAFARGATAAFVSGLTEEAILQQLQDERPDLGPESLKSMAAMSVMFGTLGAATKGLDSSISDALVKERIAEIEDATTLGEKLAQKGITSKTFEGMEPDQAFSAWAKAVQDVAPEMTELAAKGTVRGSIMKTLFELGPGRTITSPFSNARMVTKILSDTSGFLTKAEEAGQTFGPSVETRAAAWRTFHLTAGIADMNDAFDGYRKAGGAEITRARDFYSEVGKAMRRGDQASSAIKDPKAREAVARAAQNLRKQTIDPLWQSAVDVGLYHTVDADLKGTAPSYFMRVYDRERVKADVNESGQTFREVLADWLRRNPDKIKKGETPESLAEAFEDSILKTDRGTVHMGMVREAGPLKDRVLLIPDRVIEPWLVDDAAMVAGRYVNTLAGEIELARAFREALPPEIKATQGRLNQLRNDLGDLERAGNTAREISERIQNHRAIAAATRQETKAAIREAMDRQSAIRAEIKGLKQRVGALKARDEAIPGDLSDAIADANTRLTGASDELRGYRETLRADDAEIRVDVGIATDQLRTAEELENLVDSLEADLAEVRRSYARRGANLSPQREALMREANEQAAQAKTVKDRQKIKDRLKRDLQDIEIMRDRILGHAGIPDNPDDFFFRATQGLKRVNFLRFGGTFGVSSAADATHVILRHGFKPMGKMLKNLIHPLKSAKKTETSRLLWASELTQAARRSMSWADIHDEMVGGSLLEKTTKALADRAGKVFGIDYVNGWLKANTSLIASDEFLKLSRKIADGSASAKATRQLAQAGIDKKMAKRIVAMSEHWEADETGKFFLPHGDKWTDTEAAQTFRHAVFASVRNTIIEPGVADLPRIMSDPVLSTMLQFKSFMFASTNRILASGLNEPDAATFAAMTAIVGWGGIIYGIKQLNAGREIPESPAAIALEAVDHSGVLGVVMEANNMFERFTGYGMNRALGGHGPSRYQARNAIDAIFGPSIGTITDFAQASNTLAGAIGGEEVTPGGVHAMRRLAPYQNAIGIRQILDHGEEVFK